MAIFVPHKSRSEFIRHDIDDIRLLGPFSLGPRSNRPHEEPNQRDRVRMCAMRMLAVQLRRIDKKSPPQVSPTSTEYSRPTAPNFAVESRLSQRPPNCCKTHSAPHPAAAFWLPRAGEFQSVRRVLKAENSTFSHTTRSSISTRNGPAEASQQPTTANKLPPTRVAAAEAHKTIASQTVAARHLLA